MKRGRFGLSKNPWVVSEGRSPQIFIPKPAACTSVSAALRSKAQVADKVKVQEAPPPAGLLGAEALSLMQRHFLREPAKRCFRAMADNQVFSTVCQAVPKARFACSPGGKERMESLAVHGS